MAKEKKAAAAVVDPSKPRPALRVSAKQDSRWRCGRNFGRTAELVPLDELTDEEIERFELDAQLVVTRAEIPAEAPAGADK